MRAGNTVRGNRWRNFGKAATAVCASVADYAAAAVCAAVAAYAALAVSGAWRTKWHAARDAKLLELADLARKTLKIPA